MSASAREDILSRLGNAPEKCEAAYQAIDRNYELASSLDEHGRLELFIDRLVEYGAGVYRCGRAEIPATIAGRLLARESSATVIPKGFPSEWLPNGVNFLVDSPLPYHQLDAVNGVITGCAAAIADTGTIILDGSAAQGRRALTLLPDYHLCIVFGHQVLATVPEAMETLASTMSHPLTFISGPSATADIEMTRVQGVHGPRSMDVILVSF